MKSMKKLSATVAKNMMAKPKTAGTVAARVTAKRLSGQGTGLARPKAVKMARQMEKPMKATAKMARQMEKPLRRMRTK